MQKKRRGTEQKRIVRLREEAYELQRGRCYWCGDDMHHDVPDGHPSKCTAEHLNNRAQLGKAERGNIVAACWKCNQERGKKFNSAWMRMGRRQRGRIKHLGQRGFYIEVINAQLRGELHIFYSHGGVGYCVC